MTDLIVYYMNTRYFNAMIIKE